jgi:hypothetical protein
MRRFENREMLEEKKFKEKEKGEEREAKMAQVSNFAFIFI